MQLLTSNEILL